MVLRAETEMCISRTLEALCVVGSIILHILPVEARLQFVEVCSQRCKCDEILLRVNCTRADLTVMPDIRANTRALILDRNRFNIIEKTFFAKMTNLRQLSLAWNQIDDIQDGSFRSQRKVMKMDLQHNRLGEVPLALKHMKSLLDLDLSWNQIGVLTNIATTPTTQEPWSNLTNIQRLLLDHNSLTLLPVVVFSKLINLVYLSVSNNHLLAIPDGALINLKRLEFLNLSSNNLTTMSVSRAFPLNRTSRSGQESSVLDVGSDFSTAPTIEIDYVADNNANGITTSSFKELWGLTMLDLQSNQMQELLKGVLSDLANLETLYLENNTLDYIQEGAFDSLLKLKELYLQENSLSDLPKDMFEPLRSLAILNLDNNYISDLASLITNVHMFHLWYLSLVGNDLTIVPSPGFTRLQALEELYVSNNKLQAVPEIQGLSRLRVIDLSFNRIREIEPIDAFEETHLERIYLQENALETVLFESFDNLEYLSAVRLGGSQYVCDCRLQWVYDEYQLQAWMYDSVDYVDQMFLMECQKPRLYQGLPLNKVFWSNEHFKLRCTEYAESHIVTILLISWSTILGFFLLIFWIHTLCNFKKKFGVRRPKKRYMALYFADKTSSTPLTEGGGQMTFRTFDSDSEGIDVVDEETTV